MIPNKSETVMIRTEFIRLDQLLKFCGECMSGAEAKQLILQGKVEVNHEVCLSRGKKLYSGDVVVVGQSVGYVVRHEAS